MYIHIQPSIWIAILLASVFTAGLVIRSVAKGAAAAALDAKRRTRVVAFTAVAIAAWLAIDLFLGARGLFSYSPEIPFPLIAAGIAVPLAIGGLAFGLSPSFRAALQRIPQQQLIGVHGFRIVGYTFLVLFAQGRLPAAFALPAGLGDIAIGLVALVVALGYKRSRSWAPSAAIPWNVAGVADLLNAITIGFLASTTPLQSIFLTPTTDAMASLPMVLVPVFAVPLLLMLHAVSLGRLIGEFKVQRNLRIRYPRAS